MVDPKDIDRYGFAWGPCQVERMAEFPRPNGVCRVIGVYVEDGGDRHPELEIYVSPTGRSVRVWRRGKELT